MLHNNLNGQGDEDVEQPSGPISPLRSVESLPDWSWNCSQAKDQLPMAGPLQTNHTLASTLWKPRVVPPSASTLSALLVMRVALPRTISGNPRAVPRDVLQRDPRCSMCDTHFDIEVATPRLPCPLYTPSLSRLSACVPDKLREPCISSLWSCICTMHVDEGSRAWQWLYTHVGPILPTPPRSQVAGFNCRF